MLIGPHYVCSLTDTMAKLFPVKGTNVASFKFQFQIWDGKFVGHCRNHKSLQTRPFHLQLFVSYSVQLYVLAIFLNIK